MTRRNLDRWSAYAAMALIASGPPAVCAQSPALDEALRAISVDPRDVGINPADLELMVGVHPRGGLAQLLMTQPLRTDDVVGAICRGALDSAAKSPTELLSQLSRLYGDRVFRGLIGDPLEQHKKDCAQPGALEAEIARLGRPSGAGPESGDLAKDLSAVPQSVRSAAALLLRVEREEQERLTAALRPFRSGDDAALFEKVRARLLTAPRSGAEEERAERESPDAAREAYEKRLTRDYPIGAFMVAAQDSLLAVEHARAMILADASAKARFLFRIETAAGWIVLADASDQVHDISGAVRLIVDLGGNDAYARGAGGAPGESGAVALAIDLAGNDEYRDGAESFVSLSSGLFGIGILWDEAGNDRYEGGRNAQAVGIHGVGVLIDSAGDDVYRAVTDAQACATAGYALLLDRAGDDRYECYRNGQAFAGPNAAAALIDLAGNDRYVANDSDIRYPSPQNAQHNASMSQGAASGWRADYVDGVSVNGGTALLLDAAGSDAYSCGVFGQGVGYWYGAGLLVDLGGADRYQGHWYVQGAAAHYAFGALLDRGGDDEYAANQNMSQGAGHDLSVGVLIDDAGDDSYIATTLGLGASNAAGIGLFIDKNGKDRYATPAGSCLGWCNPNDGIRAAMRAYGLFFDFGGADSYGGRDGAAGRSEAADGAAWRSPSTEDARPFLVGVGRDRP